MCATAQAVPAGKICAVELGVRPFISQMAPRPSVLRNSRSLMLLASKSPFAPGTTGVTELVGIEGGLLPMALVATTVQVTAAPLGSGETTIGEPGPATVTAPQVAE